MSPCPPAMSTNPGMEPKKALVNTSRTPISETDWVAPDLALTIEDEESEHCLRKKVQKEKLRKKLKSPLPFLA